LNEFIDQQSERTSVNNTGDYQNGAGFGHFKEIMPEVGFSMNCGKAFTAGISVVVHGGSNLLSGITIK
jgi:hypothetical protein